MKNTEQGYKKDMVTVFYLCLWTAAGILSFYLVTRLLLPFVIAWLCALVFQPLINKFVGRRRGRARRAVSALILMVVLSLMLYGAVALVNRAYSEILRLAEYLAKNSGNIMKSLGAYGTLIAEKLHIDTGSEQMLTMAMSLLENAVSSLSSKLTSWAGAFLLKLPDILFVTVIFILAAFYMSGDFDGVNRYLMSLVPERWARKLRSMKKRVLITTVKYFRAYLILLVITFLELLVAFTVLRIDYALLLAAVIAILDILPAIGVGTVLLPWSAYLLFRGDTALALSLAAVYIVITVIRQIAESHVIGSQLGIPPLATLFAVYVGFKLCGVVGMIIAPLAALLIKNVIEFYQRRAETESAL